MQLIILGNGFDKARCMPTGYQDFLRYCLDYASNTSGLGQEFEDIIRDNFWLSYFLELLQSRGAYSGVDLTNDDKWCDLEDLIFESLGFIAKDPTRVHCSQKNGQPKNKEELFSSLLLNKAFSFVEANPIPVTRVMTETRVVTRHKLWNQKIPFISHVMLLKETENAKTRQRTVSSMKRSIRTLELDELGRWLYVELRRLTRAFEIYCMSLADNNRQGKPCFGLDDCVHLGLGDAPIYVLNFNYTHLFEDECAQTLPQESFNVIHIHGEAQKDHFGPKKDWEGHCTELVLGTKDFPWPEFGALSSSFKSFTKNALC